jgi:hypothetical protein
MNRRIRPPGFRDLLQSAPVALSYGKETSTTRSHRAIITLTALESFAMSQVDDILLHAMALPPEDRALVAAALEQSLEPEKESADADLLAELQRRSAAFRQGGAARSANEVLSDLRKRQAEETNG